MKQTNTAKALLFNQLDKQVELGGPNELYSLEKISLFTSEKFIEDFIRDNSYKFKQPVTKSTINRYLELWLKNKLNNC